MNNLFFAPEHQTKVEELRGMLLNWLVVSTRPKTVHQVNSGRGASDHNPQTRDRFHTWSHLDDKIGPREIRQMAGGTYL